MSLSLPQASGARIVVLNVFENFAREIFCNVSNKTKYMVWYIVNVHVKTTLYSLAI